MWTLVRACRKLNCPHDDTFRERFSPERLVTLIDQAENDSIHPDVPS